MKKKFQLICQHPDSHISRYIEIDSLTQRGLDKRIKELENVGFLVKIKILKEESLSKEIKKEETPKAKKKVGEKLGKSQVKTKFSGKHKPQLSGAVERQCKICGRKSFSAWAFVKVGKGMKRKGTEKLTSKDFVCRDATAGCNKKK